MRKSLLITFCPSRHGVLLLATGMKRNCISVQSAHFILNTAAAGQGLHSTF